MNKTAKAEKVNNNNKSKNKTMNSTAAGKKLNKERHLSTKKRMSNKE